MHNNNNNNNNNNTLQCNYPSQTQSPPKLITYNKPTTNSTTTKPQKRSPRKSRLIPKHHRHHILYDPKQFELSAFPIEQLHTFINNRQGVKQNEMLINYLLNLAPFCVELHRVLGNAKEELVRRIAIVYKSEFIPKGKIVFKYGDNADKFYLIHEGKIDIFFPYYETNVLTEEEFFMFLLRLKRFDENEMLNNVLLLNQNIFLYDDYNFDLWIKKAYYTLLKLKIDPEFINKDNTNNNNNNNKKKRKKEIASKDNNSNNSNSNAYNNYYDRESYILNENQLFDTYEQKQLVLAIEKELVLTVRKCFKSILCDIIMHPKIQDKLILKKRHIKDISNHPNEDTSINLTPEIYMSRFQVNANDTNKHINFKFKSRKVIILKYLYVCTLHKGDNFGDIFTDSMTLFTHDQLEKLREASSVAGIQIHQFHTYRLITTIASENTYVGTITKKWYVENVRFTSEKINFKKLLYIQNNKLFINTAVPQLLKSYSICFVEKKLKQGEYLIKENECIIKDNTKIYFIIKGEFEAKCTKNIIQMDKLISELGYQSQIEQTFPHQLKDLIGTPYYENIIKKVYVLKLNYIKENDIVGLSEVMKDKCYSNSVICSSQYALVYEVNAHIIRLLIESDSIIASNKNKILKHKHKILAESLLKQRKTKLDCFFEIEKTRYEPQRYVNKTENVFQYEHNDNKGYTIISQSVQMEKNDKKVNRKIISDSYFENVNRSIVVHDNNNKEYFHSNSNSNINNYRQRNHSAIMLGNNTKQRAKNYKSEKMICNKVLNKLSQSQIALNITKNNEEDLDVMLVNSTGKFTKDEIRKKRARVLLERMREKMKNRLKRKQNVIKNKKDICLISNNNNNNEGLKEYNKRLFILSGGNGVIRNKNIKNLLLEDQSKLSLKYDPQSKENSGFINPLVLDDFNRTYNTSNYYKKLFSNSYSNPISNKNSYSNSNFELNFNVVDSNPKVTQQEQKRKRKFSNQPRIRLNYNNKLLKYKLNSPVKRSISKEKI